MKTDYDDGHGAYPVSMAAVAALLLVMWALLILISWLVTAANPSLPMRSLLSGEGLRWLFRCLPASMASPWLVYLLLVSMACGALTSSGLYGHVRLSKPSPRQRFAFKVVLVEGGAMLLLLLLLTLPPRAILLSVSGALFTPIFLEGLIPLVAVSVILMSLTYSILTGRHTTLRGLWCLLCMGLRRAAPLIAFYLLLAQFVASLLFVLNVSPR